MSDPVIAGMATMPGREDSLPMAIESLAGQVDRIFVYMNYPVGFDRDIRHMIPEGTESFKKSLFTWVDNRDYFDLKCTGKFNVFFDLIYKEHNKQDCYFLGVDDDLIYPPDYARRMIEGIERYDRKALCSFHGRRIVKKVGNYYGVIKDTDQYFADMEIGYDVDKQGYAFPCRFGVPEDVRVSIVGTGVSGWHTSLFKLAQEDFPHPNMEDIYLSKKANDLGISRVVLAHEEGWIKHIDHDWTIARHHKNNDSLQTQVYNEVDWVL